MGRVWVSSYLNLSILCVFHDIVTDCLSIAWHGAFFQECHIPGFFEVAHAHMWAKSIPCFTLSTVYSPNWSRKGPRFQMSTKNQGLPMQSTSLRSSKSVHPVISPRRASSVASKLLSHVPSLSTMAPRQKYTNHHGIKSNAQFKSDWCSTLL